MFSLELLKWRQGEKSVSSIVVFSKNPSRRNSGFCRHRHLKVFKIKLHAMLVSTAHICGYKTGSWGTFTYGFCYKSACKIVAFSHHISNDGMLTP